MRRPLTVAFVAASLLAAAAGTAASAAAPDTTPGDKKVCATAPAGFATCFAHVRTHGAKPDATVTRSSGYISADLRSAYGLTGDSTATVAIIDAYAHPSAAADLATYRAQTGLPALSTDQFVQYNQTGGSTLPSSDVGWGQEEMLDLEMVSAICPSCKIIYVAGNTASFNDLATAVNTAVAKGATVVSNSYGGNEFNASSTITGAYNHPGVAITVSSGDNGYGAQMPASFKTVTAVGGTNLKRASNARGWTETAWSGAGSGCSAYISKPTWQTDTSCSRRTVADVSAVADPATGVAVYDSYGSTGGANWYVFGGTSVAAPIIGAVYALSGNTSGIPASLAYANGAPLNDVTSGSNGRCVKGRTTSGAYLCTAVAGYDGPTGVGTPSGTGAF